MSAQTFLAHHRSSQKLLKGGHVRGSAPDVARALREFHREQGDRGGGEYLPA